MWTGCVPEPQNRLRAFCRAGFQRRPGLGFGGEELAGLLLLDFTLVLPYPPHFFGLAQRNGVEPKENAWGGGAP